MHSPSSATYQPPSLEGTPFTYRRKVVTGHGRPGHCTAGRYVYPGRMVVQVPGRHWPAERPEDCTDESGTGEWLADLIMVCRGCGLDST